MNVKQYFASIGARGGAVSSQKKADAARANAKKPRPNARKNNELRRIEKKLKKSFD
jgi:hypothetical protein